MARKKTAPGVILSLFGDAYTEKYSKDYLTNYLMYRRASALGEMYTPTQVKKAVDFYFLNYSTHNFFEFSDKINRYLEEIDMEEEAKERFTGLVQSTRDKMKEYE